MKINGSLVFDASSASEIQNLRVQKYAGASVPAHAGASDQGRLIFVTTLGGGYAAGDLLIGGASAWVKLATGGDAGSLQTEVDALETSLGAVVNSSGVFQVGTITGDALTGTEANLTEVIQAIANYASGKDSLSELNDVTITGVASDDVLQYDGTEWVNVSLVAAGIQPLDAQLTGLSDLDGLGFVVQTSDSDTEPTFAHRVLVAPAAGFTIADADAVAGDPTFSLSDDLAALEGLASTGFAVRTGADTWAQRTITGTAGRVEVANGDGAAASPTIDLATVTDSDTGTFQKVTVDAYGRVTGTADVVAADITALVDATYVNATGDSMSGSLTITSGNHIILESAPTLGTHATNKNYVDSLTAGLSWKQAVRVATTGANVDLATALENGDTLDGVTLVTGDRVLVKDQTLPEENGIYVVQATGAAVRATDMDVAVEFSGATVFIQQGTANADTGWTQTAEVTTVGTDAVVFAQFTGAGTYSAGAGLSLLGNTFNVNLGAGIAELPSDEVGIELYSPTAGAIVLTTDGTARSTASAARLHLLLAAAGGLTQDAAGLYIPADGVTNAMLANDSITLDTDGAGTGSVALGQTLNIFGTAGQGIETTLSGQTVTVTALDASTTQKGVASFDVAHFSTNTGVVSLAASLDDLTNVSTADAAATDALLTKSAGDWVPVSRATVVGSVTLDDIGDVDAAHTDGHILVSDGTNWVNQKAYHLHTEGSAATTWTVTHNLNTRYCNVTVVDAGHEVVIPQSITFDSTTQLTVTFNTAVAGYVVVMGIA